MASMFPTSSTSTILPKARDREYNTKAVKRSACPFCNIAFAPGEDSHAHRGKTYQNPDRAHAKPN